MKKLKKRTIRNLFIIFASISFLVSISTITPLVLKHQTNPLKPNIQNQDNEIKPIDFLLSIQKIQFNQYFILVTDQYHDLYLHFKKQKYDLEVFNYHYHHLLTPFNEFFMLFNDNKFVLNQWNKFEESNELNELLIKWYKSLFDDGISHTNQSFVIDFKEKLYEYKKIIKGIVLFYQYQTYFENILFRDDDLLDDFELELKMLHYFKNQEFFKTITLYSQHLAYKRGLMTK